MSQDKKQNKNNERFARLTSRVRHAMHISADF